MIQHSEKITRAKELRKNATKAETILWTAIRNESLGVKFRRQRPIGPYFADFVCMELKLIIELDGSQHGENADEDDTRTDFLKSMGYSVIRIPNNIVYKNLYGILMHLKLIIDGKAEPNDYFVEKYKNPPKIL